MHSPLPKERQTYLTNKLQSALESTAPLLREVMSDFRSFLQKTLLGTHGQEIMNDSKGMDDIVVVVCDDQFTLF